MVRRGSILESLRDVVVAAVALVPGSHREQYRSSAVHGMQWVDGKPSCILILLDDCSNEYSCCRENKERSQQMLDVVYVRLVRTDDILDLAGMSSIRLFEYVIEVVRPVRCALAGELIGGVGTRVLNNTIQS